MIDCNPKSQDMDGDDRRFAEVYAKNLVKALTQ
jgi:hypothetical protein